MRIAQVVERLEIGGLERMAVDLAIAQKRAGHEPFLYCVCHDGALAPVARKAGIPVKNFAKPLGFSARAVAQIARELWRDRIEVVHTHNSIIHHYGAAAAVLTGIPVVNTEHGLGALTQNPRQIRIFRGTIPFTDTVVFVAEEPKRFLWETNGFPPSKARVILNGIPLTAFQATPARPGSRRPRIRFGTVGRMVPVKDHAMLVKAFALVSERLPQSELHIVGYGALQEATQALANELGLGTRFRIHPPDTDIPQFLSELDVFVISSQTEGLPVCLLEAMAARLPVVSTRVGGIPEAAPEHEAAWYCPPQDSAALAETMETAAVSGELAQRGQRGASIVEDRFSIETTMRQYVALFDDLRRR
jgi:glycosyltransferase involved in cell wall biosynthesis